MRRFLVSIICIFGIFSISVAKAQEINIENVLGLYTTPVTYELSLSTTEVFSFHDARLKKIYATFKTYETETRDKIISGYRDGTYSETEIKSLKRSYENFIYHSNNLFYLLSQIEKKPSLAKDEGMEEALIKAYKKCQIATAYLKKRL